MKKSDIIISLITGEIVALYFLYLFNPIVQKGGALSFAISSLVVIFPILGIFGIWLANVIGKRFVFVLQLARFALIGALFAVFDLTILNSLMNYFNITRGAVYILFVAISFTITTAVKYFGDKFWAFEKKETSQAAFEFSSFFIITVISAFIQMAVAYYVVDVIGPKFGLTALIWANVGKIIGILIAFVWNFLGYKFIVFKK